MLRTKVAIAGAGIILLGLILWNQQHQAGTHTLGVSDLSKGAIVAKTSRYDFGSVPMYGGNVEYFYELENSGTEPVWLGELYTSCMCTRAQVLFADNASSKIATMRGHGAPTYINREIKPGESFRVKAIFNPAAHGPRGVGPVNRVIYLKTNSEQTPIVELRFNALVVRD